MQSAKRKPTEAVHQPAPGPDPAATRGGVVQELKVTGHLMTLDSGLFCIVNEANPQAAASGGLPGVRVSPPPMSGSAVEIIGFRPDGWLAAHGDAALVRVAEGGAQVLVTVYQAPGMAEAAPRLQVMRVGNGAAPAPHPVPKPEPMDMLAHIQTRGDVGAKFGAWLGEAGSGNWIEGIAVAAPEGIAAADLSYQAVLGRGWLSPWVEAGAYCGSRGMALPLLGVRVRLTGEAAETYDLTCEACFADGTKSGIKGNDETCEAESLAALEAVRISLRRKDANPKPVGRKPATPKNVAHLPPRPAPRRRA
jgi:hypothetical protein